MPSLSPTAIVIEFSRSNNGGVAFPPFQKIMRGRYERTRVPAGMYDSPLNADRGGISILNIEVIPGLCLALDVARRYRLLFDPLAEQPDLLTKLGTVNSATGITGLNQTFKAIPSSEEADLSRDKLASLWWWMRRSVTDPEPWGILRQGAFDKAPQGRVRCCFGVYSKTREIDPTTGNHVFERYLDEVEPEKAVEFGWDMRRKRYAWDESAEAEHEVPRQPARVGKQPQQQQ